MTTDETIETVPEMTDDAATVHVILVPGFWLGAWAWDEVVPHLSATGLLPHPVTLPGLESAETDRTGLTLADHVRAVTDLVDSLDGDVVLVGHSGGALVVQGAIDSRPERIRRVVYVDSGPLRDGVALREADDGSGGDSSRADHPLPSWEELDADGSSVEGIDEQTLAELRERAVAHPLGVATSPVRVRDPRRLAVPATVICTSISSELVQGLVSSGQMPTELGDVADVEYVDLPTGHWPMFSRPADLAGSIAAAARR